MLASISPIKRLVLRLARFIAGDVLPTPRDEFSEFFPARHERERAREICQRQFRARLGCFSNLFQPSRINVRVG